MQADGSTGSSVWIGLNDLDTEGTWIWEEDGTVIYTGGADVIGRYENWNSAV